MDVPNATAVDMMNRMTGLGGLEGQLGNRVQKMNDTGDLVGSVDASGAGESLKGPLTGNVTGNVTGNLTGNSTGAHTGAVTGNVTGNLTGTASAAASLVAGGQTFAAVGGKLTPTGVTLEAAASVGELCMAVDGTLKIKQA